MMNKRAPEMWRIISDRVDFKNKSVIDLGCGTGDFLLRTKQAGSSYVVGMDVDPFTAREANNNSGAIVLVEDIEDMDHDVEYDIGLCFSVLPYLSNKVKVLSWLAKHTLIALIECQYHGDGPGPVNLKNDEDMKKFLSIFWDNVEPIGKTDVVIRPAERTIWLCKNES